MGPPLLRWFQFGTELGLRYSLKVMDCLFCKIIEGKIPSAKVFENEWVFAFKDIHPQAPTHYLFIPKEHFKSLAEIPADKVDVMAQLFSAIKTVADKEGLSKKGYRTTINTGREGGQAVDHLHVHLLAGRAMGPHLTGA